MMRVAIIGSRGIPNKYGGFEQFAQYLSVGLVNRGFDVSVYSPHNHEFQKSYFNGVKIIHKYNPEKSLGAFAQFIYDLNCIKDTRKRQFDIILQLGYTSSSIWNWLFPSSSFLLTNMDGLEWKRSKYNSLIKVFLKFAEFLAVKYSDHLISDSIGIKSYITSKYGKESFYIPYGASPFDHPEKQVISTLNIQPFDYNLIIARIEPENNIEIILDGCTKSEIKRIFLVVGNIKNKFGRYLENKYKKFSHIKFLGPIYDINILNNLRYFSQIYFHGHSVGGTNPSLLEAMGSQAFICAHFNPFNQAILEDDALYFTNTDDICKILNNFSRTEKELLNIKNNLRKIKATYSWNSIIQQYIDLFHNVTIN